MPSLETKTLLEEILTISAEAQTESLEVKISSKVISMLLAEIQIQ
jgi:hypothetical protein